MYPRFAFLLLPAVVAGCTLAPRYERPAAPAAADWVNQPLAGPTAADLGWREFFGDPRLQRLVELALANNRDLRIALLKVDQARAQYRIERAALLPGIDATGSGSRQRTPADLLGTGQATVSSQYSVSVGVTSYELDLFGRVRSLKAQTLETYLATAEARRSVHLSLVAEVATQYLIERDQAELLDVARRTLAAVQANYELLRRRHEVGSTSEIDLRSAEAQVQTARANVALFERQRAQAENALALLLGQPLPADLPPASPLEAPGLLADIPPGLSADLLLRRPDLLQAEHELKAASANIGAARAAFFPKITLTGSAGTASPELSGLFTAGSDTWSFVPQVTLPIFAGGRNLANLQVAQLSRRIEIAQYEKAVQTAFREVADALVARGTYEEQLAAHEALVQAQQRRFQLADARYRQGVDSYLAVLTAQQDLYNAQQNAVQSRFARWTNRITLYKALGGGWNEHTIPTTTALSSASVR